ncbi:MAG: ABC transporter permease [Acidobacteriota bacterium]
MSELRRGLARMHAFVRRRTFDEELDAEIAAHLEMAAADYRARGCSEAEAQRRARVDLGGVAQLREASREVRGLPWLESLTLDVKLALRRLRSAWGLSLVSVVAMTVAIGLATVVFAFLETVFWPRLPVPEGDRLVAIQTWLVEDGRRHATDRRDFDRWRLSLRAAEEVGAFRTRERSVAFSQDVRRQPLAEISASGFRLAGAPPHLGRALVDDDEEPGAPAVAVLGWPLWISRFGQDADIVGKSLEIDGRSHTIVGVMPEGFSFPVNHALWIPLRSSDSAALDPGPYGTTFARLAPGTTRDALQAELDALGTARERRAGETFELRAMPYSYAFTDDLEPGAVQWALRLVVVFLVLLLLPPCANVAVLVYARIASRREEFAARYALGAGRARIVAQLFVESLVLSLFAAAIALACARLVLELLEARLGSALDGAPPFWMHFGLSPRTVLFAVALGVVAALIAGLWPALQATGPRMRLGSSLLGSRSVVQLGATWTFLVIVQVGVSMAVLPSACELAWGTVKTSLAGTGLDAERYLTARVLPADAPTEPADVDPVPWLQALSAGPSVESAGVSHRLSGVEPWARLEIEATKGSTVDETATLSARVNHVGSEFFVTVETPQLMGRGFAPADFAAEARSAIVDQRFVERHFGDRDPLGQRLRAAGSDLANGWEIVGVVGNLPAYKTHGTVYVPAESPPSGEFAVTLRLRRTDDVQAAASHLRAVTVARLGGYRLDEVRTLSETFQRERLGNSLGATVVVLATFVVLLLSAAGMSALASFTVQQRRHEIGVRVALGGQSTNLLAGVFRRVAVQLLLGALLGAALATFVDARFPIDQAGGRNVPFVVPMAAVLLVCIGLVSALGPARRALRLDPVDVLRNG